MSLQKSLKYIVSGMLFTAVMLIVGISVVSLTSPNYSKTLCKRSLKPIIRKLGGYTSRPQSIAIGYLNNDEILDITVANFATHNIAVFLGYGNGTFSNKILYSTGSESNPCSVAIGDFNNDNKSDIVICNAGTHSVGVFLGYGNGTFSDQLSLTTGSAKPISIAIGDLNKDTYLDIVVVGNGTNNVIVFLGNGNGYFQHSGYYWTDYGAILSFVIIGDFDRDTWLDIAVANIGTDTVAILLGCNNGTFSYFKSYSTGLKSRPKAITISDFNRDSYLDLAITNTGYNEIFVMLGDGNGSFISGKSIASYPDSEPIFLTVGDFNNDNKSDIVTNYKNQGSIGILLGYGDGQFASQVEYSTGIGSQSISVATGDFNDDNQPDIAVANYGLNTIGILTASMTGLGGQRSTLIDNGLNPIAMKTADLNNDTNDDIVVVHSNTSTISILLGHDDATFTFLETYSTGIDANPKCIAIADFNHDDLIDIVVGNSNSDNVGVFIGHGNGTVSDMTTYSTGIGSNPLSISVSDLNSDSQIDILVANPGRYSFGILFGYGNGTFSIQMEYFMGYLAQPQSIVAGDFNNDSKQDIIVYLAIASRICIFLGNGNGSFQEPIPHSIAFSSIPVILALGDFNDDKMLDVAAANPITNNIYISLGYGNGTMGIPTKYSTGILSLPVNIDVIDLNKDTYLDIIVTNYLSDSVGIFFGYGNGVFHDQKNIYLDSSHPTSIAISDFNKDGWIDVAVTNDLTNNIVVLLGNYYVYFQNMRPYLTGSGSHPYFVVVSDIDNDNKSDIVAANSLASNIVVLYGLGNAEFKTSEEYSTGIGSTPGALAVVDFNNDNHLDIGFVNSYGFTIGILLGYGNRTFGNMTIYSTGIGVVPVSMSVADLNRDSRVDIVVAQLTTNNIGIFFGHQYTDFSSTKTYSTGYLSSPIDVILGDFNNDDHLDVCVSHFLDHSIGVFLGFGNGTFANQMTHLMSSEYFPTALDIGDFNNDTHLDIAVTCHSPKSIGILLGYGNGTFTSAPTLFTLADSNLGYLTINDFNNDNRLDIAIANTGAKNVDVFLGRGNGTFEIQNSYATGEDAPPLAIVSSDFNNDDFMDIVVTISNNSNIGILLGYGNGSFQEIKKYSMGTNSTGVSFIALGNLNDDKQIDIVVIDSILNIVGIFMGHVDGVFSLVSIYSVGDQSTPISVIVSDLNNDSIQDICVLHKNTQTFGIFYGYGNGSFTKFKIHTNGNGIRNSAFAVGDFNHDHQLDIVITSDGSDNFGVLLAASSKPFSDSVLISTGTNSAPTDAVIEHFNHDQHMDIAVTNSGTTSIGILLGNDNGTFQNIITYTIKGGFLPIALATGQLNYDYCLDIAVANMYAGRVSIFLGKCDGTFGEQVFFLTEEHSISMSIVLSDLNNDNFTDITIANLGSNAIGVLLGYGNGTFGKQRSYSLGYGSHPESLDIGDFNQDGWKDIVVANVDNENVVLLLNLCEL